MRCLLILFLAAGCSARASTTPPQPTPSVMQKPEETPKITIKDNSPPMSTMTGIRLEPAENVRPLAAQTKEGMLRFLAADLKITCEQTEGYEILSTPNFRQTDAISRQILKDAKDIGWSAITKKQYSDGHVFDMRWHSRVMNLIFVYAPTELDVLFCTPPRLTPKGKK